MSDVINFEIIKIGKGRICYFNIKNKQYPYLEHFNLTSVELSKAIFEIADFCNNKIGKGCSFTVS